MYVQFQINYTTAFLKSQTSMETGNHRSVKIVENQGATCLLAGCIVSTE